MTGSASGREPVVDAKHLAPDVEASGAENYRLSREFQGLHHRAVPSMSAEGVG